MKKRLALPLVAVLACVPLAAEPPRGSVITPVEVFENRALSLDPEFGNVDVENLLTVRIKLEGSQLSGAFQFRSPVYDEVTDDQGEDLIVDLNQDTQWIDPGTQQPEGPSWTLLPLWADLPSRKAKQIVRMRGHIPVRIGIVKTIRIPKLKQKAGHEVTSTALENAMIILNIEPVDEHTGVTVKVSGLSDAVRGLRVINDAGKDITLGTIPLQNYGWQLLITEPPGDNTSLEVDAIVDGKWIDVPFDLHNIKLP